MNYAPIEITSTGLSLDNYVAPGGLLNLNLYSSGSVTLVGNVVINPTTTALEPASFSVLWTADITLSTFSVVIAGVTISQDQVNQSGTFTCFFDGTAWDVQYFANGIDAPQAAQGVTNVIVPAAGTPLTLVAGVDTAYQVLVGSPTTLTSNYTVTAGTTGIKAGSQFQVEVSGGVTLGANTMTVFGISVNANQALNGGIIIYATFDGSVWRGVSTSKPLSTADLDAIAARTVMGNATNATAAPANITFPTDFGVLQRNGTTLTTGLLTANNFDPTSVVANRVSIVSLTSSQVKLLHTVPITIVPASGINTVNIISSITVSCSYAAVTYTGDTGVVAYFSAAYDKLYEGIDLLGFTSTSITQMNNINIGAQTYQYIANVPLLLSTPTSNPLTGDGAIRVTVIYQTIGS